jgi:uncharacterized protein
MNRTTLAPAVYHPTGVSPTESPGLLLHPWLPQWLIVNDSALRIATELIRGFSVAAVSRLLTHYYTLPHEQAEQDVAQVWRRLAQDRFFETEPAWSEIPVPPLKTLFLHITTRCNLACRHCYICRSGQGKPDIPFTRLRQWLVEFRALGGQDIIISGGEPLLHPEIQAILSLACQHGRVQLLTNGTMIDRAMATFLATKKIAVQISLDGCQPAIHDAIRGAGSFAQTCQGIKELHRVGMSAAITLAATLMRPNMLDLPQLPGLARDWHIPRVRFLPLRRVGRAETPGAEALALDMDEYRHFFATIASVTKVQSEAPQISCGLSGFMLHSPLTENSTCWCPAGQQVVVDIDGECYPCALLMAKDYAFGNLFRESLEVLTLAAARRNFWHDLLQRRMRIPACRRCLWRNFCQAGCAGQAVEQSQTLWAGDAFCQYRDQAYRAACDRLLRRSGQKTDAASAS